MILAAAIAGPAFFALLVTVVSIFGWPRGRLGSSLPGTVSILIPARDEERSIERAILAALTQPAHEVLVYDDQSRDRTAEIVERLARRAPRLRRIEGTPLPPGWIGKAHACFRLAQEARGDWLVYADADVELRPGALERIGSIALRYDADLITAVPRQVVESWAEQLIVPLLHLVYTSWLPAPLVWASSDPRMTMANGQLLAVRRDALSAMGGWAAVRGDIVEDMAIARAFKRAGHRVVFADGHDMASCRMYQSAREVWDGFTKNLYEGLGSPLGLGVAIAVHLHAFVVPVVALAAGGELMQAGLAGVIANLAQRSILVVRHRQPVLAALLQPLAVLGLVLIALGSWWRALTGRIDWRGRRYGSRIGRPA